MSRLATIKRYTLALYLTATSSQYCLYHHCIKIDIALLRVQTIKSFISLVLSSTGSNYFKSMANMPPQMLTAVLLTALIVVCSFHKNLLSTFLLSCITDCIRLCVG